MMKIKVSDNVIVFFSAIESLEIDSRNKSVLINTISGAKHIKKFNDLDDAIDYLDKLSDDIGGAVKPVKKQTSKKAKK